MNGSQAQSPPSLLSGLGRGGELGLHTGANSELTMPLSEMRGCQSSGKLTSSPSSSLVLGPSGSLLPALRPT